MRRRPPLVQGVCIGRSAARGLRIGRLRAEYDRCNGKSHRCGRAACRRRQRRGRGDVHGYDHGRGRRFRTESPRGAGVGGFVHRYVHAARARIGRAGYGDARKRVDDDRAGRGDRLRYGQETRSDGFDRQRRRRDDRQPSGVEPAGLVAGPRGRCADHQFGSGRTGSRNPYPRYELDQRLRTALCGGRNVHRQHQLPQCE